MSDLQNYIAKRKIEDPAFVDGFEEGYNNLKVGVLLKQAREMAGFTQAEMALQLHTQTATISKIENNSDDVRLSLIRRYAEALGKNVYVRVF